MKTHNTTSPPRLIALLAGAALLGLVSQTALAATASGSTISNLSKLSYSVGGTPQGDICSSPGGNSTADDDGTCVSGEFGAGNTSFVVDNKVNLTVAKFADATVIPGTTNKALVFTITNNGNTTQRYALSVVNGAETFTTNIASTSIYLDNGATPNAWDGTDTPYSDASTFGNVAAGGSIKVLIVADIPAPQTNGQTAVFNLLAQTVDAGTTTVTTETAGANTAGVDVVFADAAGSAGGDTARDGEHSEFATYTVATSAITVTKTVSLVCDPYNGVTNPKNIPGAITKWTITVANGAGGADATLTTVADSLVASLVHDANLVVPTNAATCGSGTGTPESAAGKGFKVFITTPHTTRNLGGSLGGTAGDTSFFTTGTADGLDISGQDITATFATILPTDGNHTSAGLLKANESVQIIFNTTVQ